MKRVAVSRRVLPRSSRTAAARLAFSPAIVGGAQAAPTKLKRSSSLPNDPKYANGAVCYDNLVKSLKANGVEDQIQFVFFPDNQLGRKRLRGCSRMRSLSICRSAISLTRH
jgi:TRAP-type transport system periplasmic protein